MQHLKEGGGRKPLPDQVLAELARFVLLLPLAQMEFRSTLCDQVTCSDASTLGGGICVSEGLTSYGVAAANSQVRGDIPEEHDFAQVLTVGLFDGVGALRVAADALGLPVAGHVSVEIDPKGRRVVESWFPASHFYEDVRTFGEEEVARLALEFSNVGLVLIGAGPPCQGVSGLNADKKGALRDSRSSLFKEVPRIEDIFRRHMPWAQVHRLMESVASMSEEDRQLMSKGVDGLSYRIDAFGVTLCHRPRLYWPTWELQSTEGALVEHPTGDSWSDFGNVKFFGTPDHHALLEPGWSVADEWGLPTFTTSRPRQQPGRRPAGIHECLPHEIQRWTDDKHRFPPYQYRDAAGLQNKKGEWRRPSVVEREALMGFPVGYTAPCVPKGEQQGEAYLDSRLSQFMASGGHCLATSPVMRAARIMSTSHSGGDHQAADSRAGMPAADSSAQATTTSFWSRSREVLPWVDPKDARDCIHEGRRPTASREQRAPGEASPSEGLYPS